MAEQQVALVCSSGFKFVHHAARHFHLPNAVTRCIAGKLYTKSGVAVMNFKCKMPRREIVLKMTSVGVMQYLVDPVKAKEFQSIHEDIPRIYTTSTGVKIEEIVEGSGPAIHEDSKVEFHYVCRRFNGYFVYSTVDQLKGESKPVSLALSDPQIVPGLKEVLVGMKAGGKRRAVIPPDVGYVSENLEPQPSEFGPRRSLLSHVKEPLVFEVQVLKVI